MDFLENKIPAFGYYKEDIEGRPPLTARFHVHVNDLTDYTDVLNWYLDLNSGGVAHTNEELTKVKDLIQNIEETK